jgi:hypothetical protein
MRARLVPAVTSLLFLLSASAAAAQTPYRAGAGVSVGLFQPAGRDLDRSVSIGVIGRLQARRGWGPTIGFSWMSLDLRQGDLGRLGRLRVRPLMAGASYTITGDRLSAGLSLVGGYAFNRLSIDDPVREQIGSLAAQVRNSPALRPGLSIWYQLTPRLGLNLFGGYLIHRPEMGVAAPGFTETRRLNADTWLVSAGLAVWVF